MHILVVGNVLKDVYLNLDSRTENFERDGKGIEWTDLGFNASEHHYFNRMSSFGGAAITLEVLHKMGLKANISDKSFRYTDEGPVIKEPTAVYRYILVSDNGVSYVVPSEEQKTTFATLAEPVEYLYIDRSACLTSSEVNRIVAYLDHYKTAKMILYLKDFKTENISELIKRASVIFLEENENTNQFGKKILEEIAPEKIIGISEKCLSYLKFREMISVDRIDRLTHLSAYSIISSTILGGFILGKTVETSLRMAKINVENSNLNSTLSLEEIEKIASSTSESNLEMIAASLMVPGKGILAADESGGSMKKKLESLGIEDTAKNRHDYREILLSTPELEKSITGVILFDETARDTMEDGQSVPDYLISKGIVPGIKVDKGLIDAKDIPDALPEEKVTDGLEGLAGRMREYYQMGLRFAKWRAAFEINPTTGVIKENCRILAEYAAISQSAGIVPIVEPEVVYDGDHDLEACERATGKVLDELFRALNRRGVNLKACILKCNMILAGKDFNEQSTPDEVGRATARVLRAHVPSKLAGIVFLSGGQTPEQATENLKAVSKRKPFPWGVTFSFSRALQGPALEAWNGDNGNRAAAWNALSDRLAANTDALDNA